MIAAIISPDIKLRERIESGLGDARNLDSVLIIPEYPNITELQFLAETRDTYVVFIDFSNGNRAVALASEINRRCPLVRTVAMNVGERQSDIITAVRAGVCDVIPQQFSGQDIRAAVVQATRKLAESSPSSAQGVVHAFLPAKPGSGASTLATYSALACSRMSDRRLVLLDFDLLLGITAFVLKLDSKHSILDALENAGRIDRALWDQLVSERGNLDILGSAPGAFGVRFPVASFQAILKWAMRNYSVIAVDLPGTLEGFEIATLEQAGMIFLVCGSDLVSIHMARQMVQRLNSLGLLDNVSVLLNRVDKATGLSVKDIEQILGIPVRLKISADERSIRVAVQEGTGVNPRSPLGKQIDEIARKMVDPLQTGPPSAARGAGRRFIEYFSIPQDKGLDPWRT